MYYSFFRKRHVLLSLVYSVCVLAFTKEMRSTDIIFYTSTGYQISVAYDPFVISAERIAQMICSEIECSGSLSELIDVINNAYVSTLLTSLQIHYQRHTKSRSYRRDHTWVEHAHSFVKSETIDKLSELEQLSYGIFNISSTSRKYEGVSSMDKFDPIFVDIAIDLFNNGYFDHVETLCYQQLHRIYGGFVTFRDRDVDLNHQSLLNKIYVLLSEANRANGNLEACIQFGSILLHQYMSKPNQVLVYRL